MKEKLKVAMCVFLSLSIATLSVYCVGKNATGRFSIFENTALAAAYSTMPDGKIARNNAPAMNTPQKTEASEHSRQNVITKKTDGNEKRYPVSEVTLSDENVEGYNFSIRNTTSYNIDVEEMLGADLPFEFSDSRQVQVLIVHTHTCESYMTEDGDSYPESFYPRTTNNDLNVYAVGEVIKEKLKAKGIGVIHAKEQHDNPSYDGAYSRSYDTIRKYLDKYKGIKVVIDLHRDSMTQDDNTKLRPVFTHNGKKGAQIMIMSGYGANNSNFPTWEGNLNFALKLQQKCESLYPGMMRPLYFGEFTYNMNANSGSLLIEFGTDANTLEQAKYSAELFSDALSQVLQNS